ncbi:TonB-dependent siderophore receptor [Rhizobium sp. TRM95111]|uniref:TonB-dependent siderophore receptor n=1 Tax=Rhizobium alarense TaxID=2846851 RepID=UPI001F2CAFEE|nr:TonB-dependent siderophore receptor [Rhizobium alarense]MCF3643181.1 TonB-dependent siderophore receptor [Rhizobium alarense]
MSRRSVLARASLLLSCTVGISISAMAQDSGTTLLRPIEVQGEQPAGSSGLFDEQGYVAKSGRAGGKTDAALIETPQSVSVITQDEMEAQGAETLNAALRYTAGVAGENYGADTRGYGLQIRGFNVSDEIFYVDGLHLKGTGFASFLPLETYGAEAIELVRGPASVLYGQNSPGGLINYSSKRPTSQPFGEVGVSIGSFDRYEAQFDLGGPLSDDGVVSYRLAGLGRKGDTHVDFVDDDRVYFAPAVTWAPDDETNFTVFGKYQKDSTGWGIQFLPASGTVLPNDNGEIPNDRFVGEPGFDRYDLTIASIGYELEHQLNETWAFRQNVRYSYLKNVQDGVFGAGLNDTDGDGDVSDESEFLRYADEGRSRLSSFAVDNQAEAVFDTGALGHKMLFGLDYQYTHFSDWGTYADVSPIDIFDPDYGTPLPPLDVYTDATTTQHQVGLYVNDQIKLDRFVLNAGLRHDWAQTETLERIGSTRTDKSDNAFSGRLGLVYLADNGLAPYASYSTSFMPVLDDPSFEPETGRQYEVGIKYQPPGYNSFVTLSAFDLTKENAVRYQGNTPTQTGEVRSRGIEIEGVASLAGGWDIKLAYAYVNAEIMDDTEGTGGNTPYGVPQNRASLWAKYTLQGGALEGLGLGAGVRYIGSSYGDDANSFKVPSVTLVDLAANYTYENYEFQLNVSNLFDKRYVASCFSESAGCFFGEGRKIVGTVKYRW